MNTSKTNKTNIITRLALGAVILTSTSGCGNEFSTGLAVGAGLGVAAGVIVTVAVMSESQPSYYSRSNYVSVPTSNAVTGNVVTRSSPTPNPKPTSTPTPTPVPTPTPIIVYVPVGTSQPTPTPTPSPTPTPAPAIVCSDSSCSEVMVKPPTTRDAFQTLPAGF